MSSIVIRIANESDVPAWRAHSRIHMEENGVYGPHFSPIPVAAVAARYTEEKVLASQKALARSFSEPDWLRIVLAEEHQETQSLIVGSAVVSGGSLASETHRGKLGLGVLHTHWRKGIGERLMHAVIELLRAGGVGWLDLGVFAVNEGALALYRKLGFVEIGRVVDRFRVDGVSLTDVEMTLKL